MIFLWLELQNNHWGWTEIGEGDVSHWLFLVAYIVTTKDRHFGSGDQLKKVHYKMKNKINLLIRFSEELVRWTKERDMNK